jgi:quercetin dioxygenase-like cupin family protein
MHPYNDTKLEENIFVREFSPAVEEAELVWHRDFSSRNITVVEGTGWKLQFDNKLPEDLIPGDSWFIPSMVFHRIWRGEDKLILKIRELN